ncbi:hypothetical protein CAPN010_07510 [Capnocytophaga cynodegmi]|uniref:hypothetical protein n=1 Tax=Capnocytophaga cynodegmi TaxID=28189 RepID=UPI001EE1D169|nr:hypothetical protein [Capnocytophaga cynodegmi]GJQ06593.1 hypothetical protein CAPN010_07510 [Capnocytophaga cynodegmi]
MAYRLLIILLLTTLFSCRNNKNTNELQKEYKTKSIDFEDFDVSNISANAQTEIRSWKAFQSLMQVIVSMAPSKIKNTENLINSNPDSLLVYNRLFPVNTKTIHENATVERDWRTHNNLKDTIFRFEKKKDKELSFIQWNKFLVKNIPYTFSVFAKNFNYNTLTLSFSEKEETLIKEIFVLDSFYSEKYNEKKIKQLDDDWKELQLTFTPKNEGTHSIKLSFEEDSKNGDNILFYRPTLQIPTKYFSKIGEYSDKIIKEQSFVESSYYTVFFWLMQIEEELKQLLAEDAFPEKINVPAVKARFRLFETQVKELADNVKNNPNFQKQDVQKSIKNIQNTFNEIILRINNFYDSDLENQMQKINLQSDTIQKNNSENTNSAKDLQNSESII